MHCARVKDRVFQVGISNGNCRDGGHIPEKTEAKKAVACSVVAGAVEPCDSMISMLECPKDMHVASR
eukprot:COSAG02_NODE_11608_length_1690_cov_2.354494_1_plen_66_part_10